MAFVSYKLGDNLPFNYTMVKAPDFRASDQMIELHMDGRFLNPSTLHPDVPANTVWKHREITAPQKEQVFVHESTLTSLIYDMSGNYGFTMNGTDLTQSLMDAFPELKEAYGPNASC